jgi:hypothetical protein
VAENSMKPGEGGYVRHGILEATETGSIFKGRQDLHPLARSGRVLVAVNRLLRITRSVH